MIAKFHTVTIAAAFAALAIAGASIPAAAADNQTPGFDNCFALAVERGSGPNKRGGTKEHSQHNTFMDQCMAGKIPFPAAASLSAAKLPANAYALTVASKRINRHARRT
jgi:hypothetical protein